MRVVLSYVMFVMRDDGFFYTDQLVFIQIWSCPESFLKKAKKTNNKRKRRQMRFGRVCSESDGNRTGYWKNSALQRSVAVLE